MLEGRQGRGADSGDGAGARKSRLAAAGEPAGEPKGLAEEKEAAYTSAPSGAKGLAAKLGWGVGS